jgi:enamine deaminase RidA (YjgF/YER057c/UK114 family)
MRIIRNIKNMEIKQLNFINPVELNSPMCFVEGPLKLCFIAGHSSRTDVEKILTDDFRTQVQNALHNLKIALQSQSMTSENVVRTNLMIVNPNREKVKIWEEEAKKVWKNSQCPTSTLIPVNRLLFFNMLFEIDAIAVKNEYC